MIERLLEQDMKFVRSHVLVSQETEKGERPVTFDQISQFNKVKFVVPDDLPMPVYPITTRHLRQCAASQRGETVHRICALQGATASPHCGWSHIGAAGCRTSADRKSVV